MSPNASRLNRIGHQLRVALLSTVVLLATAQTAHAHLATSGVGPFYDGMAHFFVSPQDLLVVVALSLLGGMAGKQVSLWVMLPLVAVIGAVHGWLNGEAVAATGTSLLAGLGIVSAAAMVGLLLSAVSISLTASWQRVALRVAGSWIAAIGLLAIAWQFRTIAS